MWFASDEAGPVTTVASCETNFDETEGRNEGVATMRRRSGTENAAPVSPSLWHRKDTNVNGGPLKSREMNKQPFMEAPHCQGLNSIKRSVCNTKSMFLWFLFSDFFLGGILGGLRRRVACFTSCYKTINVTNGWRCQMGRLFQIANSIRSRIPDLGESGIPSRISPRISTRQEGKEAAPIKTDTPTDALCKIKPIRSSFRKLTHETCIFKEIDAQTLGKLLADLSERLIGGKVCIVHHQRTLRGQRT